ncbi:MAG: cytochrome c oxidase subunit I [Synechococcus sp. SB0662_bin_45]|nr:cytochrome c oxidase subunit I [Synechococcus sp. SB0668_bin_13]MXX09001.1 cytochrome c oxidase subunit I [Synechococcus sp. SB0667_bin_8]MXY18498.1 cytochrome c oxidase subunit I [Synechococcus sp. SB0664_bin_36]MYE21872.1 cytochrome c oxidase subunit I [Synechococcus sp. SB0662_bin_45]MYF20506.1 cytochrome c oxidase subunit I [Synechococcus sp. SB0677_bin_5]MYG64041.1 cytochrome c oxidase subunit I [Synechococcus sp. SB0675_bin_7]MYI71713.1 cytochrome c oxidase subunit I [Synechococcus s
MDVQHHTPWHEYFGFSLDHKVIGIQYLVTGFFFYLVGGALAGMIRVELVTPLSDFMARDTYNQVLTLHGTIMIFLWIVPVVNGAFGNYLVPFYVGARDMAFPRLNAVAFWMLPPAGFLLLSSYFIGGAAQSGWTAYPPLSITTPAVGQIIWIISVLLLGGSSIFGAVNFIATILKLRRPGLGLFQLPMFCWAMLGTSVLVVLATPVLAGALILLSMDIVAGTGFFNPALGGNAVVYQHLFWFYSHPAVYIMVLPAFGLVSEILPIHARKPLFGYRSMIYSILGIVFLGLIVWAHHMFTSGTPPWMRLFFTIATAIIAVPTGIKFFNWLATLWQGKLALNSALLFCCGFIFNFVFGGITGVALAQVPFDVHVHDTYFVVAHFHYIVFGGTVFVIFAAIYHWFPKMSGRLLNEHLGRLHCLLSFLGFNICFFPQHWLGLNGMPRRVAEYDPQFQLVNQISSVGALLLAISTLPFLVNVLWSAWKGAPAGDNPWRACTTEWLTSSPPPVENWLREAPLVTEPYDYGSAEDAMSVTTVRGRELWSAGR